MKKQTKKQYFMKVEDMTGRTIFAIPKLSQGSKYILKIMLLAVAFSMAVVFFARFIIPIMLDMINQFVSLVYVYLDNLDNLNIRFFGGLIFLYIGWKILEAILYYWSKLIEWILKEATK